MPYNFIMAHSSDNMPRNIKNIRQQNSKNVNRLTFFVAPEAIS